MELKNSLKEDALANLYRAALYLGRGSKSVGLEFLDKAKEKLGSSVNIDVKGFGGQSLTILAERILDEYKRLKFNLS